MSKYREEKRDLSDPHQQAAAQQDTREVKREPVRAEKNSWSKRSLPMRKRQKVQKLPRS
jgi:FtsZ-binding cell division protein ZapB